MTEADPRKMLGDFIRAHRENLAPVKPGGRRRTPGLRREELADLAGLGLTWITWLEQGRDVRASAPALARLADALQLTPAARCSLFDLAGQKDPATPILDLEGLSAELMALPDTISVPAYLLDHTWTARAWNQAAADLFVGWLDAASADRNLLRYAFLSSEAQSFIVDWETRAQRLAAEFRADFNRRPGDPDMNTVVDHLRTHSPHFSQYWGKHHVLYREGGGRQFNHPLLGELKFTQTTLLVASQQEIKLVCLHPVK